MSKKWKEVIAAVGMLALAASVRAAAPGAAMLANSCAACHGTHGVGAGLNLPSIAGQRKEYFVAVMKGYKSGERPATIMGRLAAGYSDAEIDTMADYFAAQKPVRQNGPLDAKLVEKGKTVFYKNCKFCHLDNGQQWGVMHQLGEYDRECRHCHAGPGSGLEAKDDIPVIAGQWLGYLEMQLADFKNGKRKISLSKSKKLTPLSREDLTAVAHFCASQAAE